MNQSPDRIDPSLTIVLSVLVTASSAIIGYMVGGEFVACGPALGVMGIIFSGMGGALLGSVITSKASHKIAELQMDREDRRAQLARKRSLLLVLKQLNDMLRRLEDLDLHTNGMLQKTFDLKFREAKAFLENNRERVTTDGDDYCRTLLNRITNVIAQIEPHISKNAWGVVSHWTNIGVKMSNEESRETILRALALDEEIKAEDGHHSKV